MPRTLHRLLTAYLPALLATLLLATPPTARAEGTTKQPQPTKIQLWPDTAPVGDGTREPADTVMTVFPPSPDKATGAAVVICPGGGYIRHVLTREGPIVAQWLAENGITGIVLEYRLPKGRPYVPLLDAQRAIRLVRLNAEAWNIDKQRIGILGFSAGGHLASTAGTHFDAGNPNAADPIDRESCRPDFMLLVYPVVTMGEKTHGGSKTNLLGPDPKPELVQLFSNEKQVTDNTPPAFLAHAKDDTPVPPENSRALRDALKAHGVAVEYLELPSGGHGLYGCSGPMWEAWKKRSLEWMTAQGIIAQHDETFQDGETVCFLGDSITHGGAYHGMIYDYYLTRFPDRTIHFVNAGIAGDSAGGALGRLEEDVLSKSPSTVVVMLGMNDVGRGNYVADPTPKQLAAEKRSMEWHQANMDKLLARIQEETDAHLILMTPSPFDQTGVNDRDNNQPGCNDALGQCADYVRQLAAKYDAQVVDLHGPMTAFNVRQQKADPTYTIIGPDRVHPGPPGHLMMARLFLDAQKAPSLVSRVTFDAAEGQVTDSSNATVSDIKKEADGWSFTVLEKALPFPIDSRAQELLEHVPVEHTLNREIVQFKGLPIGNHTLTIDGVPVATHTAQQWATGVNLAFNDATPQVKQAKKVAELNEKRHKAEVRLRGYACVRWFLRHRRVDPDDLEAIKTYAETKMGKTGYYESKVPTYLKEWPNRQEVIAEVAAFEQQALQARTPIPHRYQIRPQN